MAERTSSKSKVYAYSQSGKGDDTFYVRVSCMDDRIRLAKYIASHASFNTETYSVPARKCRNIERILTVEEFIRRY